MRRLVLRSFQSPGDVVMLTAAMRDLHAAAPGQFLTDVRTSADALFENNPHITRLQEGTSGVESLDMHYPLVHQSNQRPYHFLHGYAQYLEERLGLRIPLTRFAGDIHLSDAEKRSPPPGKECGIPEHFWIIIAGGKNDFTAKWWNPANYQAVVDHFRGRIQFVQCGEAGHWHLPLTGVIDLLGKTNLREFVRLMYHADGVLCPVTFAMHLAAAVETKPGRPRMRSCVVVAGGREPKHWEAYPQHQFLDTIGMLPCCAEGGCWKSRCQLVGDGDPKDRSNVCEQPVQISPTLRIPRCLDMITAEDVIRRIEMYYEGGVLRYADQPGNEKAAETKPFRRPIVPSLIASPPDVEKGNGRVQPAVTKSNRILLRFRHGLGDAAQATAVIKHLRKFRPECLIDVVAMVGKHNVFEGIADNVFVTDRGGYDRREYAEVFDLAWPECATCYAGCPSTKVERCLQEVFGITPIVELCRYEMRVGLPGLELARAWLEKCCSVEAGKDGRYPVVLIHYEGNTSREEKDLPVETVRRLCDDVIECGHVPVILDWDRRSPLPDGCRIHNPHCDLEMWGGTGTGDGQVLAALIELSALLIGIDSGPLHIAGATTTPSIGVWTGHHPLHYFCPADHVTHLVPHDHLRHLRGDQEIGQKFFERNYRYCTWHNLEQTLRAVTRERLDGQSGGLVETRGFWIRTDNAEQDLVVVQDIAEEDSYHIDEIEMPAPTVLDVGAHIGCFAKRLHRRNPLARIVAVECCPENIPVLKRNTDGIATVVQAAVTYGADLALLNAVFPDCVTTGGSTLIERTKLEQLVQAGKYATSADERQSGEYWADFRSLQTVTLESLMRDHGMDRIDVLKLDCEGSEFSILEHTPSLDRIGIIIGEYHGRDRFMDLVRRRFSGWDLRILRDGDLGTFWLKNPQQSSAALTTARRSARPRLQTEQPLLIAGMRNRPEVGYQLLLMEAGRIVREYTHDRGWLRGFTRFAGRLWTIDSFGRLFTLNLVGDRIQLEEVSSSPLAWEAHDLTVFDGRLATAAPPRNAVVLFDPVSGRWSTRQPWIPVTVMDPAAAPTEATDQHHVNSLLADGDGFYLSVFSATPKPAGQRWREVPLDRGLITRWGPEGFAERPLAAGLYAPHSLRRYQGHIWWCDSFRRTVCRDDGWVSPDLAGFARGLTFRDGACVVGLSKSRVHPYPEGAVCGICVFDPDQPDDRVVHELAEPVIEVYDVLALNEDEFC